MGGGGWEGEGGGGGEVEHYQMHHHHEAVLVVLGRSMWCSTYACGDIHAVACQVLVFVACSREAYILCCNGKDYSFGSLNNRQTGVHIEGIAGHNRYISRFAS